MRLFCRWHFTNVRNTRRVSDIEGGRANGGRAAENDCEAGKLDWKWRVKWVGKSGAKFRDSRFPNPELVFSNERRWWWYERTRIIEILRTGRHNATTTV